MWAYYPEVLIRAKGPAAALEWMNTWKDSTDNMIYSEEGKGGGRKGRGARALLILGMVSECLQGRWWVAYAHSFLWYPWGVSVWVGHVMPAAVAQACTVTSPGVLDNPSSCSSKPWMPYPAPADNTPSYAISPADALICIPALLPHPSCSHASHPHRLQCPHLDGRLRGGAGGHAARGVCHQHDHRR